MAVQSQALRSGSGASITPFLLVAMSKLLVRDGPDSGQLQMCRKRTRMTLSGHAACNLRFWFSAVSNHGPRASTEVTFTPGGHEPETEVEQCPSELIGIFYWVDKEVFLEKRVFREGPQMNTERKSSKAGERAAEGLREATAKEEAKNESKTGHDLAKGADRFEERSKSSDGKSAQEKQKG